MAEAKSGNFNNAGTCKTLLTQTACGFFYKILTYATSSCSPLNFQDVTKGSAEVSGIGETTKTVSNAISKGLQDSIDDLTADYPDANVEGIVSGGAQGISQSVCMAALGLDVPISADMFLDSAYAFPMKTTTITFPKEREFMTFNPAKGNVVYNYNLATQIIPGCKLKSAEAYLKCVGPEDQGRGGVECGEQGCDCMNARDKSSPDSRKRFIEGGRMFNIEPHKIVSLPILSPQRIDSDFRYDHMVVELQVAPGFKPESCFDEGHRDGKFYYPLTDVSPKGLVGACQADTFSGKFHCAEIQKEFGTGGAYMQDPFISCYDKKTGTYTSCDTPNLFTKGDEIKVKTHVFSDGGKYCLKVTTSGVGSGVVELPARPLPENLPGSFPHVWNLGTVGPGLFTGSTNKMELVASESDPSCNKNRKYEAPPPSSVVGSPKFGFGYLRHDDGKYSVTIPSTVGVDAPFTKTQKDGSFYLINSAGSDKLSVDEVRSTIFSMGGFKVSNLIGAPSGNKRTCTYQVTGKAGQGFSKARGSIKVIAELMQPEANGKCFDPKIRIKAPSFGKSRVDKNIVIQMEPLQSKVVSQMHKQFKAGSCNFVQDSALGIINREVPDLEDATAIFYSTSCHILKEESAWRGTVRDEVCSLSKLFFDRTFFSGKKTGDYKTDLIKSTEFQKINRYMDLIKNQAGCTGIKGKYTSTGSVGGVSGSATSGSGTCQQKGYTIDVGDGFKHKCLTKTTGTACKDGTAVNNNYKFSDVADATAKQKLTNACKNFDPSAVVGNNWIINPNSQTTATKWQAAMAGVGISGNGWVGKLDSNGKNDGLNRENKGRDTIIFIPKTTDLTKSYEVIYWYHGIIGFNVDMRNRLTPQSKRLMNAGQNFVLVFPELPWSYGTGNRRKGIQKSYFTSGNHDLDFTQLHKDVKSILSTNFGSTASSISVTMLGHSAGGAALWEAANQGHLNGVKPSKITLSDADYYDTTQEVWDKYVKDASSVEYNLFVKKPGTVDKLGNTKAGTLTPTKKTLAFLKTLSPNVNGMQEKVFAGKIHYYPLTINHPKIRPYINDPDPAPNEPLHHAIGRTTMAWSVS